MILFLDFDGVLHPDSVYLKEGVPTLKEGGELFMWAGILEEVLFDYGAVRIVLSSSWVRSLGFDRAKNALPETLQKKVIGSTWHSSFLREDHRGSEGMDPKKRVTWYDEASRYDQIMRYVDRSGIENWCAVDDHATGWPDHSLSRLVKTDSMLGISDLRAVEQLREMLSKRR